MRKSSTIAAATALLALVGAPAEAVVLQKVLTVVELPNGAEGNDGDKIEGFDQDDIDRDILTRTVTPLHQATASAGVFGAVGLEAVALGSGLVIARTDIEASFVNDTGRPGRAVSKFIVDGGSLSLIAAAGAQAALAIRVTARTLDFQGDVFHGRIEIDVFQDFGAVVVNNVENDFIETRLDPTAAIPTTLVDPFVEELDLGVIGANETVEVTYGAVVVIDALAQGLEFGRVTFSDPFSVNLAPPTFVAVEPVSLPPTGAALAGGVALLGLLAARRRQAAG